MSVKKKASILIVDDSEELVESLYLQFNYAGFNVTKTTNPVRALELTSLIRPDVLIVDIRMPKLDGIKLIRKFKAIQPDVKVILMTGYYPEYEKSIKEAMDQGLADRVIQKGFKSLDIERLVYQLLKGSDKKESDLKAKGKILFVDDEVEVTDCLKDYFSEEGFEVLTAKSAMEAFEAYNTHKPDVVVTDIKMPECDGFWLIQELKEKNAKVRIIVMTGQDDHQMLERFKEAGISGYFSKPFSLNDLAQLSEKLSECTDRSGVEPT